MLVWETLSLARIQTFKYTKPRDETTFVWHSETKGYDLARRWTQCDSACALLDSTRTGWLGPAYALSKIGLSNGQTTRELSLRLDYLIVLLSPSNEEQRLIQLALPLKKWIADFELSITRISFLACWRVINK